MNKEELLYLSLQNQFLIEKTSKKEVVSKLLGLQAQFANNPKYALRIRALDFSENNWGDGLVKIWSHRNTLHAVDINEVYIFLSAKGVYEKWHDSWLHISEDIKHYWSEFLINKISLGIDERDALKKECEKNGMEKPLLKNIFHGWGGFIKEMTDRGLIAYHIGTNKKFVLLKSQNFIEKNKARLIILERYFKSYGPATIYDASSFTGYKISEIKSLIKDSNIRFKSFIFEDKEYLYIGELSKKYNIPKCIFLAGFDELIMGYKDRSRFLDEEDKKKIVTCSGIIFPTILLNGKIRAKWKKDKGNILITPFISLSKKDINNITMKAKELFSDENIKVIFINS